MYWRGKAAHRTLTPSNILPMSSFYNWISQKRKRQSSQQFLLTVLGSLPVKVAQRTLMKLTSGRCRAFVYLIFHSHKFSFSLLNSTQSLFTSLTFLLFSHPSLSLSLYLSPPLFSSQSLSLIPLQFLSQSYFFLPFSPSPSLSLSLTLFTK